MRIVIAGPPKTGNVWIKHILADLYNLRILDVIPNSSAEVADFVKKGSFRDRSIFHQHLRPVPELFTALQPLAPYIVTINRNPYDAFVSLYHFAQRHSQAFNQEGHGVAMMVGKPIDHPDVISFLEEPFRDQLELAQSWIRCGRSILVRYEDLYHDPYATMERLAEQIKPMPMRKIRKSVDSSSADVLKKRGGYWNVHIRTATVGDWQTTLKEEHLRTIREHHGDLIRSMGYDVA